MRRFPITLSILIAICAPLFSIGSDDVQFDRIAGRLTQQSISKLKERRIAVIPFEYADKRTSEGGELIASRLIDSFVAAGKFRVVERAALEKVFAEIQFQRSGAIDAAAAKEIGKGLGADAIVTGTISDSKTSGRAIINARIIRTDTFEILGSAKADVERSWAIATAPAEAISDPAPQQVTRPTQSSTEELVAFNTNSFKYHCLSCSWAIKCTRNCITIPRSEAIRRGGIPCKVCGGTCR